MSVNGNFIETLIEEKSIPRTLTLNPTIHAVHHQLANRSPAQFGGVKFYNPEYAKEFSVFMRKFNNRNGYEKTSGIYKPFALALKKYLNEIPQEEQTKNVLRIKGELDSHLKQQTLSAAWLLSAYFRSAAAISKASFDEREVFDRVSDKKVISKIYDSSDLQNSKQYLRHFKTITKKLDYPAAHYANQPLELAFDYKFYQKMKEICNQFFRSTVLFYPVPGVGKFGLSLLLSAYLKGEYLLGLPNKSLKAHGTEMSPLGFITHDAFHANIDNRDTAFLAYVRNKINAYVNAGGDANVFAYHYLPYAIKKYQYLMDTFQKLYYQFVTKLLPKYGKKEYDQTLVGFFVLLHEFPQFKAKTFQSNDLDYVINQLSKDAISALSDDDTWESPYDPFTTSPIDGQILLNEEEFFNVIEEQKMELANTLYSPMFESNSSEQNKLLFETFLAKTTVDISQRFIVIEFTMRSGEVKTLQFATLYHKWQNIDDILGLLQLAGNGIVKPAINANNVEEHHTARNMVQDILHITQETTKDLIKHFRDRALYFVNYKGQQDLSLNDSYFETHFKAETTLNAKLNDLKEYQAHQTLIFSRNATGKKLIAHKQGLNLPQSKFSPVKY